MADNTDNKHEYFFELLTEEIPAWMHEAAQAALVERLTKVAEELGVSEAATAVRVYSTSRRVIVFLQRLPLQEADRDEEVKGPARKVAYDADGNATPALNGFLRKNNATVDDLLEGGDSIRIRRRVVGRKTEEILQKRIPEIIESLRWPKMMRWSEGTHAYIRPVHSVISIFGDRLLPLSIFGIAAATSTVGHRTLSHGPISVTGYGDYVSKLELARVVVDPKRRTLVMAERARVLANEVRGVPSADETIWSQWQYLTEYPGVVRAEFRPEYLVLPEEVLVTVMRVHQKQLPIRDAEGKLTSSFLAVLDNEGDPEGNAAYGNSFVTNARFADAQFFYETDRRKPLDERISQLSHLQFQEKLGNYLEKSKRIEEIVRSMVKELTIDGADSLAAARLCKTDLVTEMVKEFTDLQGQVGGIYAREEGMPEGVWQAIYDHYLPVSLDGALPRTLSGALVSIADKVDTLAGFFLIGARPTGSKDPFALRRAAQGIVQILLNRDKREVKIGIERLVDLGLAAHHATDSAETKKALLEFFAERVRTILESPYGFAYDEIAAAMESGWTQSLTDLSDRAAALKAVRNDAAFLSILDSAKRIANITTGHTATVVDASKLESDVERRLDAVATLVGDQLAELVAERNYRRALESFAGMAPELEAFFKDVMVMVDDEAVRSNRLSLLRKVGSSVAKIADVTKIVVDRKGLR